MLRLQRIVRLGHPDVWVKLPQEGSVDVRGVERIGLKGLAEV